jgi:hypothetical protein
MSKPSTTPSTNGTKSSSAWKTESSNSILGADERPEQDHAFHDPAHQARDEKPSFAKATAGMLDVLRQQ